MDAHQRPEKAGAAVRARGFVALRTGLSVMAAVACAAAMGGVLLVASSGEPAQATAAITLRPVLNATNPLARTAAPAFSGR